MEAGKSCRKRRKQMNGFPRNDPGSNWTNLNVKWGVVPIRVDQAAMDRQAFQKRVRLTVNAALRSAVVVCSPESGQC